jgi:hypothetical protein
MKYYAEIINGIVANLGTFIGESPYKKEEQTLYEITKLQYDNTIAGKTTEQEMLDMIK